MKFCEDCAWKRAGDLNTVCMHPKMAHGDQSRAHGATPIPIARLSTTACGLEGVLWRLRWWSPAARFRVWFDQVRAR